MLERLLRYAAIVLSLIIFAGFAMFAMDEFNRASNGQRSQLAGYETASPTPVGEQAREHRHSTAREYIDDANDVLLRPFAGVYTEGSRWMQRMVPTAFALFLYGFGIAFLARFMRGRGSRIMPARPRTS